MVTEQPKVTGCPMKRVAWRAGLITALRSGACLRGVPGACRAKPADNCDGSTTIYDLRKRYVVAFAGGYDPSHPGAGW